MASTTRSKYRSCWCFERFCFLHEAFNEYYHHQLMLFCRVSSLLRCVMGSMLYLSYHL